MDTTTNPLFQSFDLSGLMLKNRIVMAPLTRSRATQKTDAPNNLNAIYYSQRASSGLIISEATQISPQGKGYAWTPGIYSKAQIKGWREVTDAVHIEEGAMFAQLWHVGRISHTSMQPEGQKPVAPSAIRPHEVKTFTENGGFVEVNMPRALSTDEIKHIIADYKQAALNAIDAGFDGVEIHAANGYLIQQFLSDRTNHRKDGYGGSIENRMRFALEVFEAVADAIGYNRVGIRLSPVTLKGDAMDSSPKKVYFPLVKALSEMKIAYVHAIEGDTGGARDFKGFDFPALRDAFQGAWMVNNGYSRQMAIDAIESGYADLVAFGKPYIANPDLVERFMQNAPLNQPIQSAFYGGGEQGYIDYPPL